MYFKIESCVLLFCHSGLFKTFFGEINRIFNLAKKKRLKHTTQSIMESILPSLVKGIEGVQEGYRGGGGGKQ